MNHIVASLLAFGALLFTSSSAFASHQVQGLGVSYDVYDMGPYTNAITFCPGLQGQPYASCTYTNTWFAYPLTFKHAVWAYDLNPSLVQRQMRNMRESGADVIVLHMSALDFANCASSNCHGGVWAYFTDLNGGALATQQNENFISIMAYAASIGFRKVYLRYGSSVDVDGSGHYDEAKYQIVKNFIFSTHDTAVQTLKDTATRIQVDLGGEQAGNVQALPFLQRLWKDYTDAYGVADTLGFSAISCPDQVTDGNAIYAGATNPPRYPAEYSFSNYGCYPSNDAGAALVSSWNALPNATEKAKPVMVIESQFNNASNASTWANALSSNPGLNLTDVVEWLTTYDTPCGGCDGNFWDIAIDTLQTNHIVSNYLSLGAGAPSDNLNPTLLNVDGSTCTWSAVSNTCLHINVVDTSGSVWQIYILGNNGTRLLSSCNAGAQTVSTPNFIAPGTTYRLDYYRTTDCTTPQTGTPDAVSYFQMKGSPVLGPGPLAFGEKIASFNSKKCIDIPFGQTGDGVLPQQWDCNDNPQQGFQLYLDGPTGTHYIIKNVATGKALDVVGGSSADGAAVQQYTINGNAQQSWTISSVTNGVQFVNFASGKCLEVASASVLNGGTLDQRTCNSASAAQVWNLNRHTAGYIPLYSFRLMDSRTGGTTIDGQFAGGGTLAKGITTNLTVLGRNNIPTSGVTGVALSITVTDAAAPGFLVAWPAGSDRPTASNLNFVSGVSNTNAVFAKIGSNGQVSIRSSQVSNVVVDIEGYFVGSSDFVPIAPARLMDTRGQPTVDGLYQGGGPIGAHGSIDLPVLNRGGVPVDAIGVALNVTATDGTASTYITQWPTGNTRPLASTLNVAIGQTQANLAVAKPGTSSSVSFYNNLGNTDLVVDVVGYYPSNVTVNALSPARLLDTRAGSTTADGNFAGVGAVTAGNQLNFTVLGRGGVPSTGVGAVILNLTTADESTTGYLTAWPAGGVNPFTMNVNFTPGAIISSMVVVRVDSNGQVAVAPSAGSTDVIADVIGWLPATAQ